MNACRFSYLGEKKFNFNWCRKVFKLESALDINSYEFIYITKYVFLFCFFFINIVLQFISKKESKEVVQKVNSTLKFHLFQLCSTHIPGVIEFTNN